jgi:hypothetical protein
VQAALVLLRRVKLAPSFVNDYSVRVQAGKDCPLVKVASNFITDRTLT